MLPVQTDHRKRDVHDKLDVLLDFDRLRFGGHCATSEPLGAFGARVEELQAKSDTTSVFRKRWSAT